MLPLPSWKCSRKRNKNEFQTKLDKQVRMNFAERCHYHHATCASILQIPKAVPKQAATKKICERKEVRRRIHRGQRRNNCAEDELGGDGKATKVHWDRALGICPVSNSRRIWLPGTYAETHETHIKHFVVWNLAHLLARRLTFAS